MKFEIDSRTCHGSVLNMVSIREPRYNTSIQDYSKISKNMVNSSSIGFISTRTVPDALALFERMATISAMRFLSETLEKNI